MICLPSGLCLTDYKIPFGANLFTPSVYLRELILKIPELASSAAKGGISQLDSGLENSTPSLS